MPIDRKTNLPLGLGWPCVSSGPIAAARATPAAACAGDGSLLPRGYRPPWYCPRYRPVPKSFSGVAASAGTVTKAKVNDDAAIGDNDHAARAIGVHLRRAARPAAAIRCNASVESLLPEGRHLLG